MKQWAAKQAKDGVSRGLARRGLRLAPVDDHPTDLEDPAFATLYAQCSPYTMTSIERMYGLYQATRYVAQRELTGAVVECGVWRGGSSMMAALGLLSAGDRTREIYLYDTFKGMSEPSSADGPVAASEWVRRQRESESWCYASLEDVQANIARTAYPPAQLHYVKGKVEDTIPGRLPESIALLRLDTDWYESTLHELEHLYPLLQPGGVLIIDDYGYWEGARRAVDEYFAGLGVPVLMSRLDVTGRMIVKP
jgi:O-methyltransferase